MLYRGVLITSASGRIDDAVASHNRHGSYFRALGNPNPNPATDPQVVLRNAIAVCHAEWLDLTAEQRAAWETHSRTFPLSNRIGDRRPIGGYPWFTRLNVLRHQSDLTFGTTLGTITAPPATGHADWIGLMPDISVSDGDGRLFITWPSAPAWSTDNDGVLFGWVSTDLNPTVNFHRSPMTLMRPLEAPLGLPPATMNMPTDGIAGRRYFVKLRYADPAGSLSFPLWLHADAE